LSEREREREREGKRKEFARKLKRKSEVEYDETFEVIQISIGI
jgi:hypothetical protein